MTVRRIFAVCGLAFGLRLALFAIGPAHDTTRALRPDSSRYLVLAENLRHYGTFGKASEDGPVNRAIANLQAHNGTLPPADANGLRPEVLRTPGYPAMIAALHGAGLGLRGALVFQCLLGAAAAWAAFTVARGFGLPMRAAEAVAIAWAIYPPLVVYDNLLLTESLFVACGAFSLALACFRAPSAAAVAGLLIGAATLVRPLGFCYLPAALALVWLHGRRRVASAMLLIVLAVLPPAVWMLRNAGAGVGFRLSTVSDVNLVFYLGAYAISEERGEDWQATWARRIDELIMKIAQQLEPGDDVWTAARRVGVAELRARPAAVARVALKSTVKLVVDHSTSDLARLIGAEYAPTGLFSALVLRESGDRHPLSAWTIVTALWVATNITLAALVIVGAIAALRARRLTLLAGCGLPIVLFSLATIAAVVERMRLPSVLLMLVLAASVAARPWRGHRQGKPWSLPQPGGGSACSMGEEMER